MDEFNVVDFYITIFDLSEERIKLKQVLQKVNFETF